MPMEIALGQTELEVEVVAFDGRVLEIFNSLSSGKTRRYHAAFLTSISLATDKKGKHTLVIDTLSGYKEILGVSDDRLPVVQQLVTEVQSAMARDR